MKYIFVTGGVISGIGKGVASASIALLLKTAGYKVAPLKMDPYLNIDAGTMNPIEHGEVFVLDDGTETDQDLGHYERFFGENLNKTNIATQGSIYWTVLQKERNLEYGGGVVDVVTHITEEILHRISEAARAKNAEIVVVEIGGTAGEYQNVLFLEANRLLKLKKHNDVIHIHVTYLPIPGFLGEMKSKPAQMSVRDLNAVGIQPDIILARSEKPLDQPRIKKLAISTGLEPEDVISAPDVKNVYEVPLNFEDGHLTDRILSKLGIKRRTKDLKEWRVFVKKWETSDKPVKIGIVGKYFSTGDFTLADSYISVIEAIKHAAYNHNLKPEIDWIDAHKLEGDAGSLNKYQGIIVPGGFGSRDVEGKINAVRFARENKIPYLGLCYGLQMAVIEYARNVLGFNGAHTTEVDESTEFPVIHIMPEQEKKLMAQDYGGTMRLGAWECVLKPGTKVRKLYGKNKVSERHRHRYEFNNQFLSNFTKNGLVISGTSPDEKLVEIIEIKNHPFFIATQFHPELKSRPLTPHPLFVGLIDAASNVRLVS